MKRIDSTKIKWQVQIRKSLDHKWVPKGTYETRANARETARWFRLGLGHVPAFGPGRTRVVRRPAL